MSALEIYTTHTGPLKVNTYILHDAHSAAIVDPGGNEKRLLLWLKENGLQLNKILLTHGHFDHCGAVHALKAATGAQIIISTADEEMLHNNVLSMAHAFGVSCPPCHADRCVSHGDTVSPAAYVITLTAYCFPGIRCLRALSAEAIFPAATMMR